MKTSTLIASGALLLAAGAAHAHHSFAMFDKEKSATVAGTIKTFEFTNPHVWIWLNVPAGGGADAGLYGFESGGPSQLNRLGIRKTTFNPGDKVTITYHPLKDGQKGGQFVKATLANGQTLDMTQEVKRFSSGVQQ